MAITTIAIGTENTARIAIDPINDEILYGINYLIRQIVAIQHPAPWWPCSTP
jgi:hypothetical protein